MATRLISSMCWGRGGWCSLGLSMAAATLVALSTPASAQAPKTRDLAATGLEYTDKPVRETHIAAGTNGVMSLHMQVKPGGGHRVGYAFATQVKPIGPMSPQPPNWFWTEEDEVPLGETENSGDPSVAYDSVTGNFVLGGQTTPDMHYPIVARWNAALRDFDWNGWKYLEFADGSPVPACDKPWLVAGEIIPGTPPQQEFYICYTGGGEEMAHLVYARSVNGGDTWYGGGGGAPG